MSMEFEADVGSSTVTELQAFDFACYFNFACYFENNAAWKLWAREQSIDQIYQ